METKRRVANKIFVGGIILVCLAADGSVSLGANLKKRREDFLFSFFPFSSYDFI